MSGMGPDFPVLVRKSRKQAEQYHRLYKEPIPVTQLVRETVVVMQESTAVRGRPIRFLLLIESLSNGKNVSNAKTYLEKRYLFVFGTMKCIDSAKTSKHLRGFS
ncbi:hypothetical protein DKX38_018933 [Salix brachista]|uniref:Uncharacterized protein n=1 Tax=Salix brachista TaxID=2182728 RepID=A0A5N5KPF9_9ROSI|nr:hypothetical protein DKX38_018933 [Salix brachista]